MKFLSSLLLFALIVLVSCNSPAPTETAPPEVKTPEWVTYKGTEGPGKGKHIVLISGDEEYRSEEALPQLGKILATQHGFTCTVLFAQDPADPGTVRPKYLKNIPGMEALDKADLMVVFTRFRELPDAQMAHFQSYLMAGKPVIGIRTATHAFNITDSTSKWKHYSNGYNGEKTEWKGGFGRLVLGEKWISHHGHHKHQSTRGVIAPNATEHPITNGIKYGDLWGPTDVYGVRMPLPGDAEPIMLGEVVDRSLEFDENDRMFGLRSTDKDIATRNPTREESGNPNDPMMPIAWTKSYQLPGGKTGKTFASTIGSSTDMLSDGVRRMYVNAVYWLLDMEAPASASVDVVEPYEPTAYSFKSDEYWEEKQMKVAEHLME